MNEVTILESTGATGITFRVAMDTYTYERMNAVIDVSRFLADYVNPFGRIAAPFLVVDTSPPPAAG